MNTGSAPATIVLVHGGFVDGSGWRPVYDLLTQDGYPVAVVQHPTLSLPGDAAAARLIIDAQDGPVVLIGHSYGGAVISEAGTHPNVAALVTSPRSRRTRTSRSTRSSAGSRPMGCSRRSCRPRRGGGGQPLHLRVPPGCGSGPHQAGRHRREHPAVTRYDSFRTR